MTKEKYQAAVLAFAAMGKVTTNRHQDGTLEVSRVESDGLEPADAEGAIGSWLRMALETGAYLTVQIHEGKAWIRALVSRDLAGERPAL